MHRSRQQYIGNVGEARVRLALTELGWGVPVKPVEDLGDDLLAFAHDEELGDLGLPVVIQVKSSDDEYAKPGRGSDESAGWWYYEPDTEHFDHWVRYGLPYLLVLHDHGSRTSYWTHVTGADIVATGKGRRIFVPAAQTLDAEHREDLLKVATQVRVNQLEGSAWDGHGSLIAESDRLRSALITPRLLAPHPNRETTDIRFEQAVAMTMLGRFSALRELGRDGHCPPPQEWSNHKAWGWRFVGAMWTLLDDNTIEPFRQLAEQARHPFERTAALIICAGHELAGTHPSTAFAYLDLVASAGEDATPAFELPPGPDRGWAYAQRAHLHHELGDNVKASEAAEEALLSLRHRPDDAAAAALRGGCAAIMNSVADFSKESLRAAIVEGDTAATWWRSQRLGSALARDVQGQFRVWTASNESSFATLDPLTEIHLLRWNAALSANWANQRHLTEIAGRITLMRGGDDESCTVGLMLLRLGREARPLRDTARALWNAGRYRALARATHQYVEAEWTGRAEGPALRLLSETGDLLTEETADQVLDRVMTLVGQHGHVRRYAGATQYRMSEVAAAFRRLMVAASAVAQLRTVVWCSDQLAAATDGTERDTLIAKDLIHVMAEFIEEAVPEQLHVLADRGTLTQLLSVVDRLDGQPKWTLLRALTLVHPPAAELLHQLADSGDQHAVRLRLTLPGQGSAEDWQRLAEQRLPQVQKIIDDARGADGTSSVAYYADDRLHDLALASYHLNDDTLWTAVCDALEARVMFASQITLTVSFIARNFRDLPDEVQKRIRLIAPNLNPVQSPLEPVDFAHVKLGLEVATGTVDPDAVVSQALLLQQQGRARQACEVLTSADHPMAAGMLVATCGHPDARTRAESAYHLARLTKLGDASPELLTMSLNAALGTSASGAVAFAVLQAAEDYPDVVDASIFERLARHPSGLVRRRVQALAAHGADA